MQPIQSRQLSESVPARERVISREKNARGNDIRKHFLFDRNQIVPTREGEWNWRERFRA